MADLIKVRPIATLHGGPPPVWDFPELGASESFLDGEMISLSGSAGANAVGITAAGVDASGYGILGFAAQDASGAVSNFSAVWLATPEVVFMGNVGHSTSANAQTAATDLGKAYGLTTLSGRTYVDAAKTSGREVMVRVVGFENTDVVPSFYGKVHFLVVPQKCQLYNYRSSGILADPVLV
jgi:hypothetical protein